MDSNTSEQGTLTPTDFTGQIFRTKINKATAAFNSTLGPWTSFVRCSFLLNESVERENTGFGD